MPQDRSDGELRLTLPAIYTRLAAHFAAEAEVMRRLDELAVAEAAIIAAGEDLPRMHS